MNGDFDHISEPTGLENDQQLWQTLGRAKKPEVSPYFTRRVLREAAAVSQSGPASALWRGLQAWWRAGLPLLRPPRAAAWSGALAAVAICAASVVMTFPNGAADLHLAPPVRSWHQEQPDQSGTDSAFAPDGTDADGSGTTEVAATGAAGDTLTQQDADVIADLDDLMAREETHLWTDDNAAF